ncbi:Prominin-like protein [Taenia solium]
MFDKNGFFPGIASALQSARLYVTEFLHEVRIATKPAVDNLIQATVEMQNRTTHEFNALLFNMLGIDRAFDLGDRLGTHTVSLLNLVTPLKRHLIEYTDTISSLSMAIARWNGYMEQLHVEKNAPATKSCEANAECKLPVLALADVTVSSNWRLPQFDFVIALNFVTDAQNRTPEVIEEQMKSSRLLAARQLKNTMERMRLEIDIPGSLRNLTEQSWITIAKNLNGAIAQIDNITDIIPKKFQPMVVVVSNYLFASCCLIWITMISIALGISVLLFHFHCVDAAIKPQNRRKIRCVTSFVLIILIFCIFASCSLFLVSGYAHTEFCRYISPDRAVIETSVGELRSSRVSFVLDTHVNAFLDRNWVKIIEIIKKVNSHKEGLEIPIPRIRSPIYALNVACRENAGILDAFGALETFNFSIFNKPEITNEFVGKGRVIMRDALLNLNATEMFPPALTESVQLASRLDDFLIPFDKVRRELPRDFLNVTSPNKTMLMSGTELAHLWREYYAFLNKSSLSYETLTRADELASIVFNLSSGIKTLLESVDESLQRLGKLQKIGSTVLELQGIFESLINQLRNREELVKKAMKLYDSHVAKDLPRKVEGIISQYGPPLLREVGHCRNLHDAYAAGVSAVCDLVVEPLNGVWFFSGLCVLLSTVLISFGSFFLLHKVHSFSQVTAEGSDPPCISTHEQDGVKPSQTLSSINGVRVVQPPGIHALIRGRDAGPASSPSHM